VLGQFVAAAEGRADPAFWRSLFRYHGGSGPNVMTGWITVLFPYRKACALAVVAIHNSATFWTGFGQ